MAKRKKKPYVVKKYPMGMSIYGGVRFPFQFNMNYELQWSDGSTTVQRGNSVRTVPFFQDLNGTKAQKKVAGETFRPELGTILNAAKILFAALENACFEVDGMLGPTRQ